MIDPPPSYAGNDRKETHRSATTTTTTFKKKKSLYPSISTRLTRVKISTPPVGNPQLTQHYNAPCWQILTDCKSALKPVFSRTCTFLNCFSGTHVFCLCFGISTSNWQSMERVSEGNTVTFVQTPSLLSLGLSGHVEQR